MKMTNSTVLVILLLTGTVMIGGCACRTQHHDDRRNVSETVQNAQTLYTGKEGD